MKRGRESPRPRREGPFIRLATAPNDAIASLWQGVLAEQGIKSMLKSVDLVVSLYTSPANTHYEIYVLEKDEAAAREALLPFLEDGDNPEEANENPNIS